MARGRNLVIQSTQHLDDPFNAASRSDIDRSPVSGYPGDKQLVSHWERQVRRYFRRRYGDTEGRSKKSLKNPSFGLIHWRRLYIEVSPPGHDLYFAKSFDRLGFAQSAQGSIVALVQL